MHAFRFACILDLSFTSWVTKVSVSINIIIIILVLFHVCLRSDFISVPKPKYGGEFWNLVLPVLVPEDSDSWPSQCSIGNMFCQVQ